MRLARNAATFVWFVSMCVLARNLYTSATGPNADMEVGTLFTGVLLLLNFPVSFLALIISAEGLDLLLTTELSRDAVLLAFWLISFPLGYLQWFVVGPWALRRLRRRDPDRS